MNEAVKASPPTGTLYWHMALLSFTKKDELFRSQKKRDSRETEPQEGENATQVHLRRVTCPHKIFHRRATERSEGVNARIHEMRTHFRSTLQKHEPRKAPTK